MKLKRGPLSKVEKFYIENNEDKSVKTIAKDLNRPIEQIEKHTGTKTETKSDTTISKIKNKAPFARKERNGAIISTIMTPAASEQSDATRNSRLNLSKRTQNAIHRPQD